MRTVPSKTLLLVALLAVGAAVGCYPKAGPAPGAISPKAVEYASTKWPGTTEAQLAEGKDLYQAKCNGCHAYQGYFFSRPLPLDALEAYADAPRLAAGAA